MFFYLKSSTVIVLVISLFVLHPTRHWFVSQHALQTFKIFLMSQGLTKANKTTLVQQFITTYGNSDDSESSIDQ